MERGIGHIGGKVGEGDFLCEIFDGPDLRHNPSGSCCSKNEEQKVLMIQVESALEFDDGKYTKRANEGGRERCKGLLSCLEARKET